MIAKSRLGCWLACLAIAGSGTGAMAQAPAAVDPAGHPGRLVMLPDHRRLNLRCSGHGSPTVVLEGGFGADSLAWYKVQPALAARYRVCAYDRAGAGFSDPAPAPRDGAAIARDLDAGLRAAGIGGPFVLVGHSSGGLYARIFADLRPKDVIGMVLVDPSVPHQDLRFAERLRARCGKPATTDRSREAVPNGGSSRPAAVARSSAERLRPGGWAIAAGERGAAGAGASAGQVDRPNFGTPDSVDIHLRRGRSGPDELWRHATDRPDRRRDLCAIVGQCASDRRRPVVQATPGDRGPVVAWAGGAGRAILSHDDVRSPRRHHLGRGQRRRSGAPGRDQ